jgi:hypothetical protein
VRQGAVIVPKVRACPVDHLKRLRSSGFVFRYGTTNAVVNFPRFKIRLKLQIDGQLRTLLRRLLFNVFKSSQVPHIKTYLYFIANLI